MFAQNWLFWSSAVITCLGALYLLLRSRRRRDMIGVGLYFLSVGVLFVGISLMLLSGGQWSRVGMRVVGVSAPFIPFFWLMFSFVWGRDLRHDPVLSSARPWVILAGLAAAALGILNLTTPFIQYQVDISGAYFSMVGWSFPLFLYYLVCFLYAMHNFDSVYRVAVGSQRRKLRYGMYVSTLLTGLATFAATLAILFDRIDVLPLGIIAAMVPPLMVLLIRHLENFVPSASGVVVTRRATASSMVILIGAGYMVAMGLLSMLLDPDNYRPDLAFAIVAGLMTISLMLLVTLSNQLVRMGSGSGRSKGVELGAVQDFLEETVVRSGVEDLFERCRLFIQSRFGVGQVVLFERRAEGAWSTLTPDQSARVVAGSEIGQITEWLRRFGRPIRITDLADRIEDGDGGVKVIVEYSDCEDGIVVPLVGRQDMFGFLVAGLPEAGEAVSEKLELFLETVAGPLSLTLQNCRMTEELLASREMESFHKVASFVLHDLKNSVGMLDLMLSNAERNIKDPRFQEAMMSTIKDAVARQRRIISRLTEPPEAPKAQVGEEIDLNRLLEDVLDKVQVRKIEQFRLGQHYSDIPQVRGSHAALFSVFENLIRNAMDAMAIGGELEVRTDLCQEGDRQWVVATVRDTGKGMSPEFVETRLFRPFTSTKKRGMGIGMFQTRETIVEMGGNIQVESEVGKGTTMTVRIPV